MRRFELLAFSALVIGFCATASALQAAETAFTVEVDDAFERPLIGRTPPKDKHDERPLDVIQRFLKAINDEDYNAAAKDCLFGGDELGKDRESVEGKEFRTFCEKVRGQVTSVKLSGSSIPSSSSSVVYSKGKYWNVKFQYAPAPADRNRGYFCLLQVDGVWKILEKPHWHSVAIGKDRVPHW